MRYTPRTQGRHLKIKSAQRAKDFAELSEAMERREDPFEQAKGFLRRRGYVVFPEEEVDGWVVGKRRNQTVADVFALARARGWEPKARDLKRLDEDAETARA